MQRRPLEGRGESSQQSDILLQKNGAARAGSSICRGGWPGFRPLELIPDWRGGGRMVIWQTRCNVIVLESDGPRPEEIEQL